MCGPRTYTWSLDDDKGFTTQLDTVEIGDTLEISPTSSLHIGAYTLTVTACLPPYLDLASCDTQIIPITIDPC